MLKLTSLNEQGWFKLLDSGQHLGKNKTVERGGEEHTANYIKATPCHNNINILTWLQH